MQIIDGFEANGLKVTIVKKRHTMVWDSDGVKDDYLELYLESLRSWMRDICAAEGLTVYDVYKILRLEPKKAIYAHMGWTATDIFKMDYHVDDDKILIRLHCRFL